MTDAIEIGGVVFESTTAAGIALHRPDDFYAPFLRQHGSSFSECVRVPVDIEEGVYADWGTACAAICAGNTWSMAFEGNGRLIVSPALAPPGKALWAMRLDLTPLRATIRLGQGFRPAGHAAENVYIHPLSYPADQLLLIQALAQHRGLLVHAAGVMLHGAALVFPGASGAGKSTLARQFQASGQAGTLLSDDRIVLRETPTGCWHAFGTPWPGEAGVATAASAPLHALVFLRHGRETRIESLPWEAALPLLLRATSIPWHDEALVGPALDSCDSLLKNIPCFELTCRPDPSMVDAVSTLWPRPPFDGEN